jgi:hypothetical protein
MSAARGAWLISEVSARWGQGQRNPQIMAELGIDDEAMNAVMDFYSKDVWDDGKPRRPTDPRPDRAAQ